MIFLTVIQNYRGLTFYHSSCTNIPFNSHYIDSCLQVVLNNATVETDNPDLRDRAYIYWRLLSTDPEVWIYLNQLHFLLISFTAIGLGETNTLFSCLIMVVSFWWGVGVGNEVYIVLQSPHYLAMVS